MQHFWRCDVVCRRRRSATHRRLLRVSLFSNKTHLDIDEFTGLESATCNRKILSSVFVHVQIILKLVYGRVVVNNRGCDFRSSVCVCPGCWGWLRCRTKSEITKSASFIYHVCWRVGKLSARSRSIVIVEIGN